MLLQGSSLTHLKNLKTTKYILIPSAIFLFFFALIYSPAIQGHYLANEDYSLLWTSDQLGVDKESFASYIPTIQIEGRPLETLYYYIIFNKYINLLKSYEPVNTVRFIGIIGIGLLAFVLFLIFIENKFKTDHAVFLSILICTLPPFQIYLGQIICVVFIFSVLLSGLSILILFKAVFKEDKGGKANMMIVVPMAMVLLIASLLIYPPTAMTYWAMALIPLIMIKDEDVINKRRLLCTIFSTGVASMIIFFIGIKTMYLLMNTKMVERSALISVAAIYPKILWFITNPLYTSLNLWNIVRSKEVGLFVSTVIFGGILYGFGRVVLQIMVEKKGAYLLWNSLFRYLLVLILIPLSYSSNLVVMGHPIGPSPEHRTLIGPEIIVILLFYWGLMNIAEFFKSALNFSANQQKKIVTILLVILTVVTAFLANHNIDKYFVKQLTDEYVYVKDIINEYGVSKLSQVSKIYIIKKKNKNCLIPSEFFRTFTIGGSAGRSLVNLVLYELGMKSNNIPITYIIDSASIPSYIHPGDEDALIIDMSKKNKFPFHEDENILIIDMSKYKFSY